MLYLQLLQHNIDYQCDTWGASCLLHEMLTGEPILHEHRHKMREEVFNYIENGSLPIPNVTPALITVFEWCWKVGCTFL